MTHPPGFQSARPVRDMHHSFPLPRSVSLPQHHRNQPEELHDSSLVAMVDFTRWSPLNSLPQELGIRHKVSVSAKVC